MKPRILLAAAALCLTGLVAADPPRVAPEARTTGDLPLPIQPFTVELLDLARGEWRFPDALGQYLQLPGSMTAYAFPGESRTARGGHEGLKLAYLCCDPEFPDQLDHAELRVVAATGSGEAGLSFRVDEPYFACRVAMHPLTSGVLRCELSEVRLGPARSGDSYVAGLYVVGAGKPCPLWLVPEGTANSPLRLTTRRVGHVFSGGEPVEVVLARLCPETAEAAQVTLEARDYAHDRPDRTGEVLWRSTVALPAQAGAVATRTVTVPLKGFGVFEIAARGGGEAHLRVCRVPEPRPVDPDASAIGINLFQQQIWWYAYQAPLMARAGVHWIRPWLAWENTWPVQQPAPGQWDTRALDAALRRMARFGQRYQLILFETPAWARVNPGDNAPSIEKLDVWSQYVEGLVSRYKGRIRYYEIWNEPDGMWPEATRHSGEHYLAVLKAAYAAAKGADPGCVVLGLSHAGYEEWLDRVGQLGAKDFMDAVTIHIYAPPKGFLAQVERRRDLLRRHGLGDKPLWINELGATAYDFSPEYSAQYQCSEQTQAATLATEYAQCLSVDPRMKAYWFCTYDPRDAAHKSDWTGDAGIGVLYLGFLPKLAYAALAGVAWEVDGRRCLGHAPLEHGLHQVSFEGPVAVVWQDEAEGARPVAATDLGCSPDERLQVRDMYTNPLVSGNAEKMQVDLSHGPVYVEGSRQMAGLARAEAGFRVEPGQVLLPAGGAAQVQVRAAGKPDISVSVPPHLPVRAQLSSPDTTGTRRLSLAARAGVDRLRACTACGERAKPVDRVSGRVRLRARFQSGACGLLRPVELQRELDVGMGEPNLIREGRFLAGNLSEWTPQRNSAFRYDSAVGHDEPGSLRLDAPFDRRLVHWDVKPDPALPVRLRVWVRTQGLADGLVTLNLALFGADKWLTTWCLASTQSVGELEGGWHAIPDLAMLPIGNSDWMMVEALMPVGLVPPDTARAAFFVDAKGAGQGTIWFDELDLWQPGVGNSRPRGE